MPTQMDLTASEIKRDEHYVFQRDYPLKKELSWLLHQPETTAAMIIQVIEHSGLDVNSYVPCFKLKKEGFIVRKSISHLAGMNYKKLKTLG